MGIRQIFRFLHHDNVVSPYEAVNPGKHSSNVLPACLLSTWAEACAFFFTILIACLQIVQEAITGASLTLEGSLPFSSPIPASLFFCCFWFRKVFLEAGILTEFNLRVTVDVDLEFKFV